MCLRILNDDEKIKLIDAMPERDTVLVIWLKMLTLAGKCNNGGELAFSDIPYDEEMLAAIFNRPVNSVRLAIGIFQKLRMITFLKTELDENKGVILISNWEKHQNIEGMEKIKEQNRIRFNNYYKRKKELKMLENRGLEGGGLNNNSNNSNVRTNVRLTQPNATDIDIDRDIDKDVDRDNNSIDNTNSSVNNYSNTLARSDFASAKSNSELDDENKKSNPKPRNKKSKINTTEINFNFNTKKWEGITAEDGEVWYEAYPACDIKMELAKMKAWLIANPAKKKSRYRSFINNWLMRAQDGGGTRTGAHQFVGGQKTRSEAAHEKNLETMAAVLRKHEERDAIIDPTSKDWGLQKPAMIRGR